METYTVRAASGSPAGTGGGAAHQTCGEWLLSLRKRQGLARIHVSQPIGMKFPQDWRLVETDAVHLSPNYVEGAALVLGVEPHYFAKRLFQGYQPRLYALLFDGEPLGELELRKPDLHPVPSKSKPIKRALLRHRMGDKLRVMRKSVGLSQTDLASRMGFARYHPVSLYERGVNAVSMKRYLAYAEALEAEPKMLAREFIAHYEPVLFELLFEDA